MRILILWAVMVFAIAFLYTPANASVPVPGPTPPTKIDGKSVSPPAITIVCPGTVAVNAVSVPAGWQALGGLDRPIVLITVDKQTRMVKCWYGATAEQDIFQTYPIGKRIPDGYQCTIPKPFLYAADCRKPRPILTRESKKN